MNDHSLLNTDAAQFPDLGAVRNTSSVHTQQHRDDIGTFCWQWLKCISQQLTDSNPHISAQQSLQLYRDLPSVPLP
jgi:hypothetical protein